MSDILFGQSYYLRFDPKLWRAMQPYPPLGTLYAASRLRTRGHEVAVFDAMLAESVEEWDHALARERPRIAVLYEDNFNYLSKMCLLRMRTAAFEMIERAIARGCRVIVAGADATDHPEAYLQRGADFVLRGDGEGALEGLVDHLGRGAPAAPDGIPGLAFRDPADGRRIVETPRAAALGALDAVPFPARDLVDMARYRAIWRRRHGAFSINLASTRGCPYHCNWCAKPIWGQRYGVRSPENVVEEIVALRAEYRPDHLAFVDDIFGLVPGWIERFAALLEARDAVTPFKCLSRADLLLREGEIAALRRAGCRTVWIGAESGSQRILDAMEKGVRVEQIREAAQRLHAAGIAVGFFLQFGYPGETREDIEATFRLVRDCAPDDIGISVAYPLPGTRFHAAVREALGEKRNWIDSDDLDPLYQGPFSSDFYRTVHAVLHKEFRLDKLRRELRARRRRPAALGWRLARQTASTLLGACTLPLARRRLERLARAPHTGVPFVARHIMPLEAAARPSAQEP